MANRVSSGKGFAIGSDSKVFREKRAGVELGDEDELGDMKRIKIWDLESVSRAEGSSKIQSSGQLQHHDEEMSEITEVPVTSELDASQAGKGVRSTLPVLIGPLPKALDLNNDASEIKNKVQNDSQQLTMSSVETTSPRDQGTPLSRASNLDTSQVGPNVKTKITTVVDPIPKLLDCNTDMCGGGCTSQNGSQQYSQSSEKTRLPKTSNLHTSQMGTTMNSRIPVVVIPVPRPLDLRDHKKEDHTNPGFAKGNVLDRNEKGASSSENQDPVYPCKTFSNLKSKDISECGSCTGPSEEKDPMTVWKEMKENGFLSSTHGGIIKPKQPVVIPTPKLKQQPGVAPMSKQHGINPTSKQHGGIPIPKSRPKKNKTEEQKKKVERAKKDQVDRFTKIAAPSGLLNELNPGIINHVRNRKQVHSIIEALVRSERTDISLAEKGQTIHQQGGTAEHSQDGEYLSQSWAGWHPNTLFDDMRAQGYTILMNKPSLVQVDNIIEGCPTSKESFGRKCFASHSTHESDEGTLALKLPRANIVPEEDSPSSSKEEMTSYLSFKAATVASQWLELIQQDIQGRLAALQCSRKRVQNVISTDLPLLLKKEFSSDKENDSSTKSSVDASSSSARAEMHRARWGPRFDKMDIALLEEEEQLESWLNQVREMQDHCNKGLQLINWSSGIQALGTSENDTGSEMMDSSQREVAIRAAAASIYATCNFILSTNAAPVC